jgi:uracil-DNA glycosylase family 4
MADRTYTDIIADIEHWAKQRLISGEERIIIPPSITNTQAPIAVASSIPMAPKKTQSAAPAAVEPTVIELEAWQSATDLPTLKSMIENCTKCELHKTRTNFVFGVGNPNAKVMVIGEAPGADEDKKGEPFVGRAGQLLDKMLLAINFPREEVFIANILKSRPPGNRDPQPAEVAACEPYLWKQIDIIKPKMILCVGRIAGTNLLKNGIDSLAGMRGKFFDFRGAKVMVTYHPAALLRNPNWKPAAWEDLQKFRKLYDELVTV